MGYRYRCYRRGKQGPITKQDEKFFVFAMFVAGFFNWGVTWLVLVSYFIQR